MKVIKKTAEYTVFQKRNSRYGVQDADGKWLNADDKVKILLAEELIKLSQAAAPAEEEPAEEAPAEEPSEETTEGEEPAAS